MAYFVHFFCSLPECNYNLKVTQVTGMSHAPWDVDWEMESCKLCNRSLEGEAETFQ